MNSFKTTIEIPVTVFYDHQLRKPITRHAEGHPEAMIIYGVTANGADLKYEYWMGNIEERLQQEAREDYEG